MRKKLQLTFLLLFGILGYAKTQNKLNVPIPTQAQLTWQNAEQVTLVCRDFNAHDGEFYVQSRERINSIEDFSIFNPQK